MRQTRRSTRRNNILAQAVSCEALENRWLMSTISWINEGFTSGALNDRVNDVFGAANAPAVRANIEAALQQWGRTIANFNYPGGGNVYNITIQFAATGTGVGANAGPNTFTSDGKPIGGAMTIGRGNDTNGDGNGDGAGYFIDSNSFDNSEYRSSTTNGFAGYTTDPLSPAFNKGDLFSLVSHELGHAVGLVPSAQIQARSTRIATNDGIDTIDVPATNPVSHYWRFDSTRLRTLETEYDSGGQSGSQFNANGSQHHAPAGASVTVGGVTYLGSDDLMTPYYRSSQRRLISDTDAWMLGDAYGYTIAPPSTFGTFYDTVDSDGTLRINTPGNGDDLININRSVTGAMLIGITLGSPVAGADIINPIATVIPAGIVQKIVINTNGGNDIVRIEDNSGCATTVNGGAGNDILDLGFANRFLNPITGSIVYDGGSEFDKCFIYQNARSAADTYVFGTTPGGGTFDVTGAFNVMYYGAIEEITTTTGSAGDTFNIYGTPAGTKLYLTSINGAETVNVGMGVSGIGAQDVAGDIDIQNPPAFTTVYVNDSGNSTPRTNVVSGTIGGTFGYVQGLARGTVYYKYADTTSINCYTGSGDDTVSIVDTVKPISVFNNGGADAITIGNNVNGTNTISGNITLAASAFMINNITLDNRAGSARTANVAASGANTLVTGMTGGGTITCANAFTLNLLGSAGNDSFVLAADQTAAINGGNGSDSVLLDDRASTYQPYKTDITDTGIGRWVNPGPFAFTLGLGYAAIESLTYYACASATSTNIYGTPASIPFGSQMSVLLGNNPNTVTMYPVDGAGNRTINGAIGIAGGTGTDSFTVDATGTTRGLDYQFLNTFGSGTQNIYGMGVAGIGVAGIESITVKGGDGADTFFVDQYTSGVPLTIRGGAGGDTCGIGNGDLSAFVTSIGAFSFDGQTGNNSFLVANSNTTTPWTYTTSPGSITAMKSASSYFIVMGMQNVQNFTLFSGSAGDTFNLPVIASGMVTQINAGDGVDGLDLGASANTLDNIQGPITYNAGAGGGNMVVRDGNDSNADVVHLTDTTLGAFPGDNLFGAGGSLSFNNLVNFGTSPGITLNLGTAGDTVYAQPLASARVTINGGSPSTAPGDRLNLALASAQNFSVNPSGTNGNVTSSNRQTLDWTSFETGPTVDSIAPAVVGQNFDIQPGGRTSLGQSLAVTFSEDVSAFLSPSLLSLFNATTQTAVPSNKIAVTWDAALKKATFTFPGYANGLLPDGAYQAQILGGYVDPFGNVGAPSSVYTFVWSGGTSGADVFRVALNPVGQIFEIYLNNASSPAIIAGQGTSKIALAGGLGDDVLTVDLSGGNSVTPAGIVFDGGDGADTLGVKGSTGVDVTMFNATSVTLNNGASIVNHSNVESYAYDGNGGLDTVHVLAKKVVFNSSQTFTSLQIANGATAALTPGGAKVLSTFNLGIAAGGTLDLADNDLILDYSGATQLPGIQSLITAARAGGAWTGFGITSTNAKNANPKNTTLGVLEASSYKSIYGAGALFDNQSIDTTAVLVKYTYYGDTDFNGVVNFDDYSRTDAGFNGNKSGWLNGDFDGNGVVNFDDYSLIDLAFNTQGPAL